MRSNAPIVGMRTCIAGALGVNTNTLRKAWQAELGHAIEPLFRISWNFDIDLSAKSRDEHDDDPHRADVSQSEHQDSPGGRRQATQLACGHPSSHTPSQENADQQCR